MSEQATETHHERSAKASRPCVASDMTFGGRCLNCGFGEQETRPTPTPWRVGCDYDKMPEMICGLAHIHIARVCVQPWPSGENEATANAALIVRAVNSFEAMREALQAVMRDVEASAAKRGTYDGDQKIGGYAHGQARAALALAEKVSK